MQKQIEEFSVGQLARLSGVTVRTLHHYDTIGLLTPIRSISNGYRRYTRAEALRLQEILFYRDVGLSLTEIGDLLDGSTDAVDRLLHHRDRLRQHVRKTSEVIDTLNATIAHLKGKRDMAVSELYRPFSPEKQAEYEAWLIAEYGPDMVERIAQSKSSIQQLDQGIEGAMEQLKDLEAQLVAAYEDGCSPMSDHLHPLLERHRAFMSQMWGHECDASGYEGLAGLYVSNADFVARYEALSSRFSKWLPAAMRAQATRLRSADRVTPPLQE